MIKGKRIEGRKRKKGEKKMGKGDKINEGEEPRQNVKGEKRYIFPPICTIRGEINILLEGYLFPPVLYRLGGKYIFFPL